MPNQILHKRSNVVGSSPASLSTGEIAINTSDERLYMANSAGIIVPFDARGGDQIDGGEILPAQLCGSYGSFFIGTPDDYNSGDKWYEVDTYNASLALNVAYLVVNDIVLVTAGGAERQVSSEGVLSDFTPLGVFVESPVLYASYNGGSPHPSHYIDFLNNLWTGVRSLNLNIDAPSLWTGKFVNENFGLRYVLPSTLSFTLLLDEIFNNDVTSQYLITTQPQLGSTAHKMYDGISAQNFALQAWV